MDRTTWDLAVRTHHVLSSLKTRAQNAFRAYLNTYSPETWLVLYYPLFYLAKVAKRYLQSTAKQGQGQGLPSDSSFPSDESETSLHTFNTTAEKTTLFLVILGPLCYVFLLRYHFLDRRSWKTTSPGEESSKSRKEQLYDATNRAPESLLQTEVDVGLTEDQVSERQQRYGPNEIVTTRNWFLVLLRLALENTNPVSEVSIVKNF